MLSAIKTYVFVDNCWGEICVLIVPSETCEADDGKMVSRTFLVTRSYFFCEVKVEFLSNSEKSDFNFKKVNHDF